MRFLIDGQLPPLLAERPAAEGHVAEHVYGVGLGAAPDATIWLRACDLGCVVVTKDQDFVAMAKRDNRAKVLWIRLGNTTNRALWAALSPLLPEIIAAFEAGEAVIEIR